VEELLAAQPPGQLVALDLMLNTTLADNSALQGTRAIRELTDRGYRVCLYTDERRILVIAQCLSAGAIGVVRKCDPLPQSQQAFQQVAAGETCIPSSMVGLAELLSRRNQIPELTERQRAVLSARSRGETWEAIARRLNIKPKTAYDHLEAVMRKMVWYFNDAGLDGDAAPADVERALGLAPGDLDATT
jgi:DNA-binding NarL/FixJ family response regulator